MKAKLTVFFFIMAILSGCSKRPYETHDPVAGLTKGEFDKFLSAPKKPSAKSEIPEAKIPTAPIVSRPELDDLVSLTVSEGIPLKDVFKEISKKARVSIAIGRHVEGSVNYQAYNLPARQVIRDICRVAGLRFEIKEGVIHIFADEPYAKDYSLNFVALARESQSAVAMNTKMFSGRIEGGEGTSSGSNGSSSSIKGSGKTDFWSEVESNLSVILGKSFPKAVKSEGRPYFTIHKQAGVVTIYTTHAQHQYIDAYIKKLKKASTMQILIEAKVVEVSLKDEFKSGIDWSHLHGGDFRLNAPLGAVADMTSSVIGSATTDEVVTLGLNSKNLTSILNLMESFGTARTLSSPRLTVLNNNSAVLKVAENQVFFTIKTDQSYINTAAQVFGNLISATSQIQSVPIGLVMTVHPSIDEETNDIILTLRPTISRVVGTKSDPAVQLTNQSLQNPGQNIKSEIPVVAIREIDSVLRLKSGEVAILGGLMLEGAENMRAGIPGTDETLLDFFGGAKHDARKVTELVIFLKATVLENATPHEKDLEIYNKFMKDGRPLW